MMRRGNRRGREIADALSIVVPRDDEVGEASELTSPLSAASTPSPTSGASSGPTQVLAPAAPAPLLPAASSTAESPSPTQIVFPGLTTATDSPSPTRTTFATSTIQTGSPSPTTTTLPAITTVLPPLPPPPPPPPPSTSISSASTVRLSPPPPPPPPPPSTSVLSSSTIRGSPPPPLVNTRSTIAIISTMSPSPPPVLAPVTTTVISPPALTALPVIVTVAPQPSSGAKSRTDAKQVAPTTYTSSSVLSTTTVLPESNGIVSQVTTATNGGGHPAAIALGSIVGVGVVAALVIFFWWRKKQRADSGTKDERSDNQGFSNTRRLTHRSDDRIINELIAAAYSTENGSGKGNSKTHTSGFGNDSGYLEEKREVYDKEEGAGGEAENNFQPPSRLKNRVSKWLKRHSQQMLNPMSARASMVSSAQGLPPIDIRSQSGWGDDETLSEYEARFIPPPMPTKRLPRKDPLLDVSEETSRPTSPQRARSGGLGRSLTDPGENYTVPSALRLPPPPALSVAAPKSEITQSEGSWNTWGVMQHRDKPKDWKTKMGIQG